MMLHPGSIRFAVMSRCQGNAGNVSLALNCYSHVTSSMQREAAEALDKAIEDATSQGAGTEPNDQSDAV
jgi:hypothetical protein